MRDALVYLGIGSERPGAVALNKRGQVGFRLERGDKRCGALNRRLE